jgi:hypothetical protein
MKTRWTRRLLLLLLILAAVGGALGLPAWVLRQPVGDGTAVEAGADGFAGQSITTHFGGLSGFAVRPAGALPGSTSRLVLHVRPDSSPAGPDLVTVTTEVANAWDGAWLRFSFPPLTRPRGEKVLLLIESPDTPLLLAAAQADYYPEGASTAGGDLVFEARYEGYPLARLAALPERLSQNKPGLLGKAWFYPLLMVTLLVTALGASEAVWRVTSVPDAATPL